MKYKALHHECIGKRADGSTDYPEHHFIYDEQAHWRSTILDGLEIPAELDSPKALNAFKSIECQIMDWADDTAYSLNDIVDGIHARYINVGSLTEWAATLNLNADERALIDKLCQVIREDRYESHFGARIGRFVHGCTLTPRSGFLSDRTHRHAFDLTIAADVKAESKLYKRIALDLIFRSPQLQQIEFKGGHILGKLFRALCEHCANDDNSGLRILPAQVQALLSQERTISGRHRRLCDFTAGLTDSLAVRTYKRLYDPDFGSIAELL
jgi:dGTPase